MRLSVYERERRYYRRYAVRFGFTVVLAIAAVGLAIMGASWRWWGAWAAFVLAEFGWAELDLIVTARREYQAPGEDDDDDEYPDEFDGVIP